MRPTPRSAWSGCIFPSAPDLDAMLGRIQNDLFDLGADLAVPQREGKAERLRVLSSQVVRLENDIDSLNAGLADLTSFVLPGGTPAAAYLHLARTICRRAERMMVKLAAQPDEPVSDAAMRYMNRLVGFSVCGQPVYERQGRGRCTLGARVKIDDPTPIGSWLRRNH